MNHEIGYKKFLQDIIIKQEGFTLLSTVWGSPSEWPEGDKSTIFIGKAIQQAGLAKFGEKWTGEEMRAQRRLNPPPSFSSTLEAYWDTIRECIPDQQVAAPSDKQWDTPIPPPMDIPMSISAQDLVVLKKSRSKKIENHGSYLRTIYNHHVDKFNLISIENAKSLQRLRWTLNWIFESAKMGDIDTKICLAKETSTPNPFFAAPNGFWNVPNIIYDRIKGKSIRFSLDGENFSYYHIFFDKVSVSRSLSRLNVSNSSEKLDGIHLSESMKAIIDAIRDLEITSENQPLHKILKEYLRVNWKGSDEPTERHLDRMATVARDEGSKRGGYKHIKK